MRQDPTATLFARIEELENLFSALQSKPESPAWREIQETMTSMREGHGAAPVPEPQNFIRGGFGEEMDMACSAITAVFASLPGWGEDFVDPDEVIYLAGFFAFVALASSPTAPLPRAEAAKGAQATVARILMVRRTAKEELGECLKWFKLRLNEYAALWIGVLKSDNSFGAFASKTFDNVRRGDRTRDGYFELLNLFPEFCEKRISAFHEATAGQWKAEATNGVKAGG
jgi:hypothetical protein